MALVLAAIMVLSMSVVVAFADTTTPHTINITSDATQKEDHTYEAYQVFVGTYDTASKQLKNFAWGSGVDSAALLTELKTTDENSPYYGCDTAAKVAAVLNGKTDDSAEAKAFAEAVAKHLKADGKIAATGDKDKGYEVNVTGDGYYFIKDTSASLSKGDTVSSFMLQVVGDVNVKAKDSTTESSKKVKDADDTARTTTDWQDSADYDIGDAVPFKLTGKVADDYAKYTKYEFIFHDTEGTGLTFNGNSVVVKVDGKALASGYEVKTTGIGSDTFQVVFADLTTLTTANLKDTEEDYNKKTDGESNDKLVSAGSEITVEYTSTLNENAVIGQNGNPNTSYIEFTNNPNSDQSGKGRTPDDTVIVFTYKTTVTKQDENKNALAGADFTLYKKVTESYTGAKTGADIKKDFAKGVKSDALEANSYYIAVSQKSVTKTGDVENIFTFKGIDDGTYVLVETTVPSGYNAWAATAFTVSATHTETADINPETGQVAGKTDYILTALTGNDLFGDKGDGTVTLEAEKADLDVTIVNESGAELPETGGIGTTLFYVIGSLLIVGGGIFLVSRRRLQK